MRKLTVNLLLVFIVSWTTLFTRDRSKPNDQLYYVESFSTAREAIQFIRMAERSEDWFECVESQMGRHGFCKVVDMSFGTN